MSRSVVQALNKAQINAAAPEWVHLLPIGETVGRDGRTFTVANPQALIASFNADRVDLPIDYDHQNDIGKKDRTGPTPAAGWIKELSIDQGSIWARVEWTNEARGLISQKAYRYISPTFFVEQGTNQVFKLKGAGLVHHPNLYLKALASKEGLTMDREEAWAQILEMLDLPQETDDEAVVLALRGFLKKAENPDPKKYVPVETMQAVLNERNSTLATANERDANARVETALSKGYITPGMKPWALSLCKADPASFEAFIDGAVPAYAHVLTETHTRKSPPGTQRLGADDALRQSVFDQLGIADKA